MASFEINSSNTDIDIQKLKLEIENSTILTAKVISITPSSVGVKVLIDAPVSTSQTQIAALKTSVVDTHSSLQRRRILVYDLPDTTGSASNKDYVDSATQNTLDEAKAYTDTKVAQEIAALVNSAPAVLDTLGELSDALGDDPNFATTVSNRIGTAESIITTLEARPNITNLDAISDVTITSPVANQALQYIGGGWKNNTLAQVALSNSYLDLNNKPTLSQLGGNLDDLSDVTIQSIKKGQLLIHDGSAWKNSTIIENNSQTETTLTVKASANQSVPVFSVTNEFGVNFLSVYNTHNTGATQIQSQVDLNAGTNLFVDGKISTNKAVRIKVNGEVPLHIESNNQSVFYVNELGEITSPTITALQDITNNLTLDALSDVTVSGVQTDEILKYNGTTWVNATAPAVGLTTLNGISTETQTLQTGTTGTDFNISTTATTHTFNIPDASSTSRGVVTTGTQTLAGNKTLSHGAQINSSSSTTKSLVVRGATGITSTNIFEVQDSSSNVLLAVRSNSSDATDSWTVSRNKVGIGSTDKPGTTLNVHNSSGNTILQLTNGSESPAFENGFRIFYDGTRVIQKVCSTNAPLIFYTGGGNTDRVNISSGGLLTANYGVVINSGSATTDALIVKGAASQTANLLDLENNLGTSLFTVNSSGSLSAGIVPVARISGLATVATSGSYNDLLNRPTLTTNLDSLTDVVVTSPSTDQILRYNGTNWVNGAAASPAALPDGSAGSPALYFTNDTNTGFYRQGSDKLTFVANGQNSLVVDGTSGVGRLMIGNGTPVSRFQIADDDGSATSGITFGTNSSTYSQLYRNGTKSLKSDSGMVMPWAQLESSGNEGPGLNFVNNSKPIINKWTFYNMTGTYGDSFQLWRYNAAGTIFAATTIWFDDGALWHLGSGINAYSFNLISDYRLKQNITPLNINALSIMDSLNPVSYDMTHIDSTTTNRRTGLIAHEVAEVLPNIVSKEKDALTPQGTPDYQSVNYIELIPYLIQAVKELNQKVVSLEQKLQEAESK